MHRNLIDRYHQQLREAYAYLIMGDCNACYCEHNGDLPAISTCERCNRAHAADMLDIRREVARTGCDLSGLGLWA